MTYEIRHYNNNTLEARREQVSGGDVTSVEEFKKMLDNMAEGLTETMVSLEYEEPYYGGFATFTIEVCGKRTS